MPSVAPQKAITSSGAAALTVAASRLLLGAILLLLAPQAGAQTKGQPQSGSPVPLVEEGARWRDLSSSQRSALQPLERDWHVISANQKQKWLEIATRYPTLQPVEKTRIQARMTEWAKLTAEQRRDARVNYQHAQQVAPKDRRSQWEAYKALSPEEKSKLAAKASPRAGDSNRSNERGDAGARLSLGAQPTKSNIVPNPAYSAPPRPVAPTVQQAQPGATTTLISKRPAPPAHQQTGLPKIAAGPTFVDKATLLPKRGPQGAATRSAAASATEASQRR